MAKRKSLPPAEQAGGDGLPSVATAPDMATGLYKHFSPSLQALTGGTMDAPVPDLSVPNPVRPAKLARVPGTRLRFLTTGA